MEKFNNAETFRGKVEKTKGIVALSSTEEELREKLGEAGIWFGQINWIGPDDDRYADEKDAAEELATLNPALGMFRSKSGAIVYVQLDPKAHF